MLSWWNTLDLCGWLALEEFKALAEQILWSIPCSDKKEGMFVRGIYSILREKKKYKNTGVHTADILFFPGPLL